MKISKTVTVKEVAKARDRLIKRLEKERLQDPNPSGDDLSEEEIAESIFDYVIDEINEVFDFDGEEHEN